MWTPEQVKAFRLSRSQNQSEFASDAGVDRVTVSRWETGAVPVSELNAARLSALLAGPRDTSQDYWRGVLYAAEAMAETTHRLLREARQDHERTTATIMQTAKATLAESEPADGLPRQGKAPAGPNTTSPRGRSRAE
jgi:transcriptional regulator with XRE-family HTH domain